MYITSIALCILLYISVSTYVGSGGPLLASQPCLHAFWVLMSLGVRLLIFLGICGQITS